MWHENCNCDSCERQDKLIDKLSEKLNIEYCKCKECKKELIKGIKDVQQNGGSIFDNIRRNIQNAKMNAQAKAMQFKEAGELYAKLMEEEKMKKNQKLRQEYSSENIQDQASIDAMSAAQEAQIKAEQAEQARLIAEEEARKASLASLLEECQKYTCPIGYTDESNKHSANLNWLRNYHVNDNPQFKGDEEYDQVYRNETQKLKTCFDNNAVCVDPSQNQAITDMDAFKTQREAELIAMQTQIAAQEAEMAAQKAEAIEAQAAAEILQTQQMLAQRDEEIERNKADISNMIRVYEQQIQALSEQEQELRNAPGSLQAEITERERKMNELVSRYEQVSKEKETYVNSASALVNEIEVHQQEIAKLNEQIKDIQITLRMIENQQGSYNEEVNALDSEIQALKSQVSESAQTIEGIIMQKEKIQQEIESAKAELQKLSVIDQQNEQEATAVQQAAQVIAAEASTPISIVPPIAPQEESGISLDQLDYDACIELYNAGQKDPSFQVSNEIADKCEQIYEEINNPIKYDMNNFNKLDEAERCKTQMEIFAITAQKYQENGLVSEQGITYEDIASAIETGLDTIKDQRYAPGYCDKQIDLVNSMLKTFTINQTSQLGGCSGNYNTTIKTKNGIYKGKIIAENKNSLTIIDNRKNRKITILKKNIINF